MQITDFKLEYKENFRILHITDPQLIDSTQMRYPTRLCKEEYEKWLPSKMGEVCFNMIDDLVSKTKPDLILVEGDVIYGSFDDKGTSLKVMMDKLSSYNIPFSITYGNHDNECVLGAAWQNEVVKNTKNSLFNEGVCSIGLYDNNVLKRVIIMLDSNCCGDASEQSKKDGHGFYPSIRESQLKQLNTLKENIVKEYGYMVPCIICQHIISRDIVNWYKENGYIKDPFAPYISNNTEEEFGSMYENPGPIDFDELPLCKELNIDNIFLGHDHINNLSTMIDNVRVTFVTKTGRYDYHRKEMLGGTVSIISNDGKLVTSKHIFSDK